MFVGIWTPVKRVYDTKRDGNRFIGRLYCYQQRFTPVRPNIKFFWVQQLRLNRFLSHFG